MIRLKDSQEIVISQIDAVVAALNTSGTKSLGPINQGMTAIHSAIVTKR